MMSTGGQGGGGGGGGGGGSTPGSGGGGTPGTPGGGGAGGGGGGGGGTPGHGGSAPGTPSAPSPSRPPYSVHMNPQLAGMNVPMNQGYGPGPVPGQMGPLSSMSQQNMAAVNSVASPGQSMGPMGGGGGGMGMNGANSMGDGTVSNVGPGSNVSNPPMGQAGGGGPAQAGQPVAQPQQNKEINTAALCRLGQETVQDIVSRTQEVFQALKGIQPPNGTSQGATSSNEKKAKIQEQLRTIRLLFKRLRLIYEKCNENCQVPGMEYTHIESLIPLKEEYEHKSIIDEKKTSEAYKIVCEENKELTEQVMLKNKQLKEVINNLRKIIWEINVMLTMRRS